MKAVFADSFYFFALINPNDSSHQEALAYSEIGDFPLVTTEWVLTELAEGLADSGKRHVFRLLLDDLRADSENLIIVSSHELFEKGIALYDSRPDKEWSLTDCISFVVMSDHGITEALTGDRHFEQAGFKALLASSPT